MNKFAVLFVGIGLLSAGSAFADPPAAQPSAETMSYTRYIGSLGTMGDTRLKFELVRKHAAKDLYCGLDDVSVVVVTGMDEIPIVSLIPHFVDSYTSSGDSSDLMSSVIGAVGGGVVGAGADWLSLQISRISDPRVQQTSTAEDAGFAPSDHLSRWLHSKGSLCEAAFVEWVAVQLELARRDHASAVAVSTRQAPPAPAPVISGATGQASGSAQN